MGRTKLCEECGLAPVVKATSFCERCCRYVCRECHAEGCGRIADLEAEVARLRIEDGERALVLEQQDRDIRKAMAEVEQLRKQVPIYRCSICHTEADPACIADDGTVTCEPCEEVERLREEINRTADAADTKALAQQVLDLLGVAGEPRLGLLNLIAGQLLASHHEGFKAAGLSESVEKLERDIFERDRDALRAQLDEARAIIEAAYQAAGSKPGDVRLSLKTHVGKLRALLDEAVGWLEPGFYPNDYDPEWKELQAFLARVEGKDA